MSNLTGSSIAAGVAVEMTNQPINPSVDTLQRKIVIIGVADATKLAGDLTADEPVRVYSAEGVGSIAGNGTMIHRLAKAVYAGSQGIETWIIPQAEGGTDVAATGTITITVTTAKSGVISLYISGARVPVSIANGATDAEIATAVAAAITAATGVPVTASAALGVVTVTSKSKGEWGNGISLALNLNGETTPSGVTVAVTAMTGGSGVADISTALDAMGIGDNANENHYTALVHGYGDDVTTLDLISDYNGSGGAAVGCYDKLVGRFFRSLNGSVANDLSAEVTASDLRKEDRTNGIIVVPNSPNHPAEIAAIAMGVMEKENNILPQASYVDKVLPGVFAGGARWSDQYDNRDTAVRSGISPTRVKSGTVVLQNVVSYYRPDDVAPSNNGYRSMRNISISQNVAYINRRYFEQENWTNLTIVADTSKVNLPAARVKAKDVQGVKDAILYLGGEYERRGMIYSKDSVVAGLSDPNSVTIRDGFTGFDYNMRLVYSGEGLILNNSVIYDVNFSGGN